MFRLYGGWYVMVLYEAATFCHTLFGCEIASASLVQPIIIVYLPAVATTVFTPKTHPKHSIWSNHPTKITTHLCINFVLFPNWVIFKDPWNYVQNPLVQYQLSSAILLSCHPAKGTKVPCTDGSAICGKSHGVCKGTWQLRFIQPQVSGKNNHGWHWHYNLTNHIWLVVSTPLKNISQNNRGENKKKLKPPTRYI